MRMRGIRTRCPRHFLFRLANRSCHTEKSLIKREGARNGKSLPSVSKELSAFVDTENKVDVLARAVGLIKDRLVMWLCCPQTAFHAQVQVKLTFY